MTFEVVLEDKIVFILQLKPPADLAFLSRRAATDRQIRDRIADVNGSSHAIASHLYWTRPGVSWDRLSPSHSLRRQRDGNQALFLQQASQWATNSPSHTFGP